MASDVTLKPGESVKVIAPQGEDLRTAASGSTVVISATNVGTTTPPGPEPPSSVGGILISPAELAKLPTSGKAWDGVKSWSGKTTAWSLASQDSQGSGVVLAQALVAARTKDDALRDKVIAQLKRGMGTKPDRTLALGRELPSGVLAYDLIGATEQEVPGFKAWLPKVIAGPYSGGPPTLWQTAEKRPNNWGTHAIGALSTVVYLLKDSAGQDKLYKIFCGWMGDRSAYRGFTYTDPMSWHADTSQPRGINPKGATKSGMSIDGVLPDDQRRGGGFTTNPPNENYVWEALQGASLAALVFEHNGRPAFDRSDRALKRAVDWLYKVNGFPATGDDNWIPWVMNHAYDMNLQTTSPTQPGKNFGFTDWLYA